ncbi:hypothetical protein AAG570_006188 [Ranatra chinensis]|uniref:tRNA-queuosine alpha-mannosyltransferase n=1 Tax=Ranatra chinensis TaxID=642074 RepID=A0ABD0XXA5_9HEMI
MLTMKAKKWHWRARTGALFAADSVPKKHNFRVVFASSVLNLAELVALRPDVAPLKKVVYFHENQLVYPIRQQKDRDFQYGYNQILTCLVADVIVFNSHYNLTSFLDSLKGFFKLQPDYRPKELRQRIAPKCRVLYFPLPMTDIGNPSKDYTGVLHIVWPHRWEHDKGPKAFLTVLEDLASTGCSFRVSMVGENFTNVPEMLDDYRDRLGPDRIAHWGFLPRQEYRQLLAEAHVVVSTADHEFFGVAMLEASLHGCYPLCPERLVYPEIYPKECLYKTNKELMLRLSKFANDMNLLKESASRLPTDYTRFSEEILIPKYIELL